MKSQDKSSVRNYGYLQRVCNMDTFQMESCIRGYLNEAFTYVRTCVYTNCSPSKIFYMFNFHHLSNWQKFFTDENFPIYKSYIYIYMICVDFICNFIMLRIHVHICVLCKQCSLVALKYLFAIPGHFVLVHWPEECSVSVVSDVKVDPSPASKGSDCMVRVGGKTYKGKVVDVGELVVLD